MLYLFQVVTTTQPIGIKDFDFESVLPSCLDMFLLNLHELIDHYTVYVIIPMQIL